MKITCPYCGYSKEVPNEKVPPNAKWAVCPRCRQRFELFQDVVFEEVGGEGKGTRPRIRGKSPWERRDELGFWPALGQTMKAVLFSPENLFSTMSFQGGMKEPLAFGLLMGSVGSMFGFFWQLLLISVGVTVFSAPFFGHLGIWFILLMMVVFVPIFVVVGIFVYSVVVHLLLLIVRGAGNGFEATFRVVCFSQGVQVLGIVPLLGGWVAGIWQLIVQIIGLKEIHETSYFRVIAAFLIPVFALILLIFLIVIPLAFHFLGNIGGKIPWQW